MRYTVVWQPRAMLQLAQTWENAHDRSIITQAADKIDQLLANSPEMVGESRSDGFRTDCVGPLAFIFHVSEADRLVSVVRVWRIR